MINKDRLSSALDKIFYTNKFWCPICKTDESKMELFNDMHFGMHLIDYWSFMHIIFGIILGLQFKSVVSILIINFAFEFLENSFLGVNLWRGIGVSLSGKPDYDTCVNILGDTICVLLGFYISKFGAETSLTAIALIIIIIALFVLIDKNCSVTIFITRLLAKMK